MKEIYPRFADEVAFFAVGTDPSEDLDRLAKYKEKEGYPWPIAYPGDRMISDLRVISQSTKVAFKNSGTIIYRDGYGQGRNEWEEVFEDLISP